jgi:Zn-dependent protease with chaperone function
MSNAWILNLSFFFGYYEIVKDDEGGNSMNNIKTMVLLVMLTLTLVWAGAAFGGKQGMTMALIFALGMNFFAYWFSDKIVLRMYRAQEVRYLWTPIMPRPTCSM